MKKIFKHQIELATLEKEVMGMLLQGENSVLAMLYQQYLVSTVKKRELTGVGFFTTFVAPKGISSVNNYSFTFGDVVAEMDGLKHGVGFVLFVTNGIIDILEGYTYDEPWPDKITNLQLSYMKDKRDLFSFPTI